MNAVYRDILKTVYEERLQVNPRYSLRAYARDLGIAVSRLSCVLRGTQGLSVDSAHKISGKLNLSPADREYFCQLVMASDARSKLQRAEAQRRLRDYQQYTEKLLQLDEEAFKIISDWYHFAVVELTLTKGFRYDTAWMAKRLGITKFEVEQAVTRLLGAGLIRISEGNLVPTQKMITTSKDIPSESIKKFNRQILEKAGRALTMQGVSERDFSTLTVAIPKEELPRFKQYIKEFRRSFNQSAESTDNPDEVYMLAIQFFRLTEEV